MSFLYIVLGFGFLIFIHELGHFLVARWCGIRCPQFAVGFGQAVLAWRKGIGFRVGTTEKEYADMAFAQLEKTRGPLDADAREKVEAADLHAAGDALNLGQTEYRLNWVPLGGYVKMVGQEDTDPNAASKDPASFGNKSAKARAAVLVAGVTMNLITGLVFLVIAFTKGVEFPAATVGVVTHGSPAEKAGLQVGDQIVAVDGDKVTDFVDLRMRVVLAGVKKPLALEVLRDGKAQTVSVTPEFSKELGMQSLGVSPAPALALELPDQKKLKPEEVTAWSETTFGKIKGEKPTITALNGKQVADYAELSRALQETAGQDAKVMVHTESGEETVEFTPEMDREIFASAKDGKPFNPLGLSPITRIAAVVDESPAKASGLRKGDIVLAISGKDFPTPEEFLTSVKNADASGVSITIEREYEGSQESPVVPQTLKFQVKPQATGKLAFLGIGPKRIGVLPDYATDDTRLIADENLNLPRGSRLLTLAGESASNWNDVQRILMAHQTGASAEVKVIPRIGLSPAPEKHTLTFTPELRAILAHAQFSLPNDTPLSPKTTLVIGANPLDSARIGCLKTRDSVVQTYVTILRLFQGSVGSENINGPLGIFSGGAKVAETGDIAKFLYLLGIISINLAVMNLLPIPVLDGGHLVFLAYEKITGKPMPEKAQTVAFILGLSLLGSLMLYATWNDLMKIFGH